MYRTAVNNLPQIFYALVPYSTARPAFVKPFAVDPLLKKRASMLLLFVTAKK